MKFGSKFKQYAIPEWSDKYINYNELKSMLRARQLEMDSIQNRYPEPPETCKPDAPPYDCDSLLVPLQITYTKEEMLTASWNEFNTLLDRELKKVVEHYQSETTFLEDRLDGICAELDLIEDELEKGGKSPAFAATHKIRLRRAIIALWDCFDKLDSYVNLNKLAIWKVLKKRDKLWALKRKEIEYANVSARLNALQRSQRNEDTMLQLWSMCSDQSSKNLDINTLRAAVQRQALMRPQHDSKTSLVWFLGGICVVLVFDVIGLTWVKPSNPHYSTAAFLNVLPIYRMCFALVLLTWGFGVNLFVFEMYGINYKFLLDFNPSSDVRAKSVCTLAAEATVIWTSNFALFFIDYRYGWLLNNGWYWLYPFTLLLSMATFFYYYSDKELRQGMFTTLTRTIIDACNINHDVTLLGNMVGDILTSMVKPLADLEYTICYYTTGLWHEDEAVCQGDKLATTLITLFPFVIRCLQCLNRIRNGERDQRWRHTANLGKYISSITVILFTSIDPPASPGRESTTYIRTLGFVILYLIASQYSLYWDFVYDWGLIPDSENLVRPHESSMYPLWLYHAAGSFNLIARLTWAVTLVPISSFSDLPQVASAFNFVVSDVEIIRRCVWMLLRLENEHITNSSRYRGMLWVPPLAPPTFAEKPEMGVEWDGWRINYKAAKSTGKLRVSQKHGTAVYLKGPSNGIRRCGSSGMLSRQLKSGAGSSDEVNEIYTCPEIVKVPAQGTNDVFLNWIDHG